MTHKQFTSWRDLKTFIDELRSGAEFIWRGHSDAQWELSSSLYRYFESQRIPPDSRRDLEDAAIAQFTGPQLDQGGGGSTRSGNTMSLLVEMQHHGCPTRLMDWTWSPYIAAYFVLPDMADQGTLYALNITEYQQFVAPKLPLDDYDLGLLPTLPDRIFLRFLGAPDLGFPIPITERASSGRSAEQQSIFLLDLNIATTTERVLATLPVNVLWKLDFPRTIRPHVHSDLLEMNIDGQHLFGGTHGAALRAKEWLFGAKWHGHSIKTRDVSY